MREPSKDLFLEQPWDNHKVLFLEHHCQVRQPQTAQLQHPVNIMYYASINITTTRHHPPRRQHPFTEVLVDTLIMTCQVCNSKLTAESLFCEYKSPGADEIRHFLTHNKGNGSPILEITSTKLQPMPCALVIVPVPTLLSRVHTIPSKILQLKCEVYGFVLSTHLNTVINEK